MIMIMMIICTVCISVKMAQSDNSVKVQSMHMTDKEIE